MLDNFIFGTATSAYQIEGAWNEDGKCPSIWDKISHKEDKRFRVQGNHTGNIACDHYHRWKEDIHILKTLGVKAYRFSISWSRICTQECMCSNLKGIQFYQDLVGELKNNNIEPFVTLYHWDLPAWLDDIGGWANKKSIDYFKCYAETMFNALPEVKYWMTFNEPAVFIPNFWGHNNKSKAIKNVLLAHGTAVEAYHKNHDGNIGIALNLMPILPNEQSTNDEIAVLNLDKVHNRIWLDPIFKGELPKDINELYSFKKKDYLKFSKDESEIISRKIDFLGINYYTTSFVRYNKFNPPLYMEPVKKTIFERDDMGIEIVPFGLWEICRKMRDEYENPPIYITENGRCCPDAFVHDSAIHDTERIRYIKDHLRYCRVAVNEGCNLKGYFYWSLLDNFEWIFGYNKRFGLVYMFYPTQNRVCKDSFFYYQKIINNADFREKELKELR